MGQRRGVRRRKGALSVKGQWQGLAMQGTRMDASGTDINSLPANGSSLDRKPREKQNEQAAIREQVNGFVLMHDT